MNPTAVSATIDWTPIIVAIVGGIFSVLLAIATALINKNVKDQAAAVTVNNAVKNSLGAIQQAVDKGIETAHPTTIVPGLDPQTAVGLQYVLDHAGDEAARLGITPAAVADKVGAQMGLAKIAAAQVAATTTVTATTPVEVTTSTTTANPT